MSKRFFLCIFLSLAIVFIVIGCDRQNNWTGGTVMIKVFDQTVQKEIPRAHIYLNQKYQGITNHNGSITIPWVDAGEHTLSIYKFGYQLKERVITVENRQVQTMEINLSYVGGESIENYHSYSWHGMKAVIVDTSLDVFAVEVNGLKMHYEGNQSFSLVTTSLAKGQLITFVTYDRWGNVLEEIDHFLGY